MSNAKIIGIRREDKHQWEARVPLTPDAAKTLTAQGVQVLVQPSPIRTFTSDAYEAAGATLAEDLSPASVVFAVKEIPAAQLRPGGAYVFFSHTIKGQPYNMPLLKRVIELGCTLIDYERIVDPQGRRLVFFGKHAGLAGMIDTLTVLGRRLRYLGHATPLEDLRLAYEYNDLEEAKKAIRALRPLKLPDPVDPLVVGFTGYGNVSQGAQEIYDLLDPIEIAPEELSTPRTAGLYKVVFREQHLVAPRQGAFDLQEYYDHPERYRSIFDQHAPHLSVLINAIYWTERYPRLLSKDYLARANLPLWVVGDISCDIDGSIESTVKATTPGEPAYVYDPHSGRITDGVQGTGLCMMTTDCLPCEIPRESSAAFTEALLPFAADLASVSFSGDFAKAPLPPALRPATIVWCGTLTPDYAYLQEHLPES